jgi:hypothetical protein
MKPSPRVPRIRAAQVPRVITAIDRRYERDIGLVKKKKAHALAIRTAPRMPPIMTDM